MTTLREAAQAVVDAFADPNARANPRGHWLHLSDCITELRAALAQQEQEHEQEPVAWGLQNDEGQVFDCIAPGSRIELSEYNVPLFTHPPRREWQSLTDEEIDAVAADLGYAQLTPREVARAVEQACKEKNHG